MDAGIIMQHKANIPERLRAIAELAPVSGTAADIGCDHALTAIEMIRQGRAERVIACDVREEPLKRADKNIRAEGLSDRIELRLGDGLQPVSGGEADTVIISGMGGPLMERILTGRLKDFSCFVLSPQSELPHFRRFLIENGMKVIKEELVYEDKQFYRLFLAGHPGTGADENGTEKESYTEVEYAYGWLPLARRDPLLLRFLRKEETRLSEILMHTSDSGISGQLMLVREAISRYED